MKFVTYRLLATTWSALCAGMIAFPSLQNPALSTGVAALAGLTAIRYMVEVICEAIEKEGKSG